MTDARDVIAARAAQELHSGEVVNLGIGIPNRIPGFLDPDVEIFLHTENGLLGVGPRPAEGEVDLELIDASKKPVTLMPGAAAFDSASSFAMIRGGHVDTVVLGALEVSETGDIANWMVPGGKTLGVGGATLFWTIGQSDNSLGRDRLAFLAVTIAFGVLFGLWQFLTLRSPAAQAWTAPTAQPERETRHS